MKFCPRCQTTYPATQTFCNEDGAILSLKDLFGLNGRVIAGKYLIEALIGMGGMSAVYTAQQAGVGRRVAFKMLLPHLAANNERMVNFFEREARTVGQVFHENIATVFDAGRTEDDVAYIVMEWLDGITLDEELHRHGRMSIERVLGILRQIAGALEVAHAKRIIHRDLKPSNIMLVRRIDGGDTVKVLDFGLAKLTTETNDLVSHAVGTPHYASPEQFQLGSEIDARTDIYALGVMLFQLLTGKLPFDGQSVHEVIRLHMIEMPPAVSSLRPEVPAGIDMLIQRMMAKNPHFRPQTALEVVALFERALAEPDNLVASESSQPAVVNHAMTPAMVAAPTAPPNEQPRPILTDSLMIAADAAGFSPKAFSDTIDQTIAQGRLAAQQNTRSRWRKLLFATAIITLLMLAVAGFAYYKRSFKLNEADTVLVADFVNRTNDEVFTGTLKQALAVQLSQTPFLRFLPEDKARETLRYMGKPTEGLTRENAREICQRQGVKALIVGQIDKFDQHYSLTLEAVNSQTGEVVARSLVEADSKDQVLKALGQATTELRGKLGESLSTIQQFNKPIEYATTGSLEALQAYSKGRDLNAMQGKPQEALEFYKHASELDPNFALAYVGMASIYNNLGQSELSAAYAKKAYDLIGRISEQEKWTIQSVYYLTHSVELEKAIEVLKLAAQTYPQSVTPHNNLAVCYGKLGMFDLALLETDAILKINPNSAYGYSNRAELLMRLGRLAEAQATIKQANELKLDRTNYHAVLYQIGFWQGDKELQAKQIEWIKNKQDELTLTTWRVNALAAQGKLREATVLVKQLAQMDSLNKAQKDNVNTLLVDNAAWLELTGQEKDALELLNLVVKTSPETFTRLSIANSVPYSAMLLTLSGASTHAQNLMDEVNKTQPNNTLAKTIWFPLATAATELRRGNVQKSLSLLEIPSVYEPATAFYVNWLRGLAYLKLARGKEAALEFQKIRDNRGWNVMSPLHALAKLGLARANKELGDVRQSRKYYNEFLADWQDANQDLPVIQQAKQELAELK